ncbi:MAG: hypothetical protein RLZ55_1494 [Actinomycetota bacterium]|jgi:hypothetical protein
MTERAVPLDDDIDPGEPVLELRDWRLADSPEFVHRVERRVERRRLTSEFMNLAFFTSTGLFAVFLDLLGAILPRSTSDDPPAR